MEQKLEEMIVTNEELIFEQKEFSMISIDPNSIGDINYNDPSYLDHIVSQLKVHNCNDTNFLESIAEYSKIKQYPCCNNMETQIISFDNQHVYEMTFMSFKEGTDMNNIKKNEIGTLLNIKGYDISVSYTHLTLPTILLV